MPCAPSAACSIPSSPISKFWKKTGRPVFFRNVGASAESLDLYVAHYAETSPRAAHGKDKPEGFVSYDHQVQSEAEIERNEFYADFLKPQGYKYFVASNLLNNEDLFSRSSERACATARSRRESSNPGLACTAGPAIRHSNRNAGTKPPARHRIPVTKCKKACLLHVLGEVRLGLGAGVEESGDLHAFIEDCLGLRIGIDGNLE
jgi:hypothetical protein